MMRTPTRKKTSNGDRCTIVTALATVAILVLAALAGGCDREDARQVPDESPAKANQANQANEVRQPDPSSRPKPRPPATIDNVTLDTLKLILEMWDDQPDESAADAELAEPPGDDEKNTQGICRSQEDAGNPN